MVDLTAFIKLTGISTVLICSDDDGECSCKDVAPFADIVKIQYTKVCVQWETGKEKILNALQLFTVLC